MTTQEVIMRHFTRPVARELTGLALALTLAPTASAALTAPAYAGTGEHAAHMGAHHMIRYVSVKGCADKSYGQVPCGHWRLDLIDGTHVSLDDALVHSRDAKGRTEAGTTAPVTVSGDGESVAYFRRKDGRVVVREFHGPVHVMPADALPKGVAIDRAALRLSLDGGRLAVMYSDKKGGEHARVFAVSDPGNPATISGYEEFEGFSGDGSAVLVSGRTDDNTNELVAYDASGRELGRVVPPQVVSNNAPRALSADGRTVAVVTGSARKPVLKLYDMVADRVVGSVPYAGRRGSMPDMADWTGDHQVTVHVNGEGGSGARVTVLEIDTRTGATRVRDSYKVRSDAYVYASCGGG
ncbi:hypothetical protein [Microbispora sp. ATCC PTA-5024]|uniref:hypothetical protein n=1 Tax=Microbispora sp. ATCC PTA-5024 TaxID=316330 RepID=UPI00040C184A|nr:hypothetical protein [Microbispora sp. ATCC PTA-5024]